ncbi:TVP38/TMEM64 family protein [Streptomyces sp. UNOC14_S4]|uniref:TVP38/TMEM64 family protein n=1 Tax=Streptomyces sp. UNOC14_S4 TaxID=2872340 RepID=UPI001E44DC4E|nr:TVP38/TMEM64 family protein [Streptomyces sp. UNOC14_S4]MCC3772448.1 TVP38/TMEM64 family protein [Streptomyces sp. UNOC14_S4]
MPDPATSAAPAAPDAPPASAVSAAPSRGPARRGARALLSPWVRLGLLVLLLAGAAVTVLALRPERLLADGWPPHMSGGVAVALFAGAYGVCTAAFVPRPILNLAAGALFGGPVGTAAAVVGTVLGSALSFGLGRLLGQDALRPLLRGRWLTAADRQLSRHGFRSMLAIRLFPGVPFAAANYCAAVSRMGWAPFLAATAVGSLPATAAYVIAGSHASSPTSPAFVAATAFLAVTGAAAVLVAWHRRRARA